MPLSFSTFADDYTTATKAVRAALASGYRIDKAADPTEGARAGLTEEEAIEVAGQDASLLSLTKADLRAAINALPADDALVTDPRSIDEFEALCQSWIDDVGAQQDGADTVAIARRALGGDVDALRIVVSWS